MPSFLLVRPPICLACPRSSAVQKRAAKQAAEVMWVEASQGDCVLPWPKFPGEGHIPFKGIIVCPPRLTVLSMADELSVYIEPAFVKQPREQQVKVPLQDLGAHLEFDLIPIMAEVALALVVG